MSKTNSITSKTTPSQLQPPTPPLSPPVPTPRTITELLSLRAQQFPNEPIFGYPSEKLEYLEYTYSNLVRISTLAAAKYATVLPPARSKDPKQDPAAPAPVIGLLGPSNLDYFFTLMALSRLGFAVLFLSTRISEAAYLSLLNVTKCRHLVVDASFKKTARALAGVKPELQVTDIVPSWEYLNGIEGNEKDEDGMADDLDVDLDAEASKVAWIIHSSGSTGLPKPIYQTHKAALRNYENSLNMRGFVTLPLFHAFGLSNVFRGITAVKKIYMYNAALPLTSQNLLKILTDHEFESFLAVPYALKLLSETQEGIDVLAKLRVVMFGGSACPDALGDMLTATGAHLISHYGTTETGQLMTSFRPAGDKGWNYLREHDRLKPYMRMEARGGNLFELCVLPGWPSKVATNRDDGSYATKDLFEPHPTITGAWKYCGRLDDTIVLMNGEKAIPIAMEQALRQNRLAQEAVMFGAGRNQVGLILIVSEHGAAMAEQELIDALWPTIAAENKPLPAYAQLSRDMIRVLPADTTYPSTDKGSLMRQAFYRAFAREIEDVYIHAESKLGGTLVLSEPELRDYLRAQVQEVCPQDEDDSLTDDTDLFSLGVDSLQSTRLRAQILKDIQLHGNTLPQNVVFEYPTVTKLAAAILNIRDQKSVQARDVVKEMEDLVTKYSDFPKHVSVPRKSSARCVVVTGATGSLGAHLVAQLVLRDDVSEVCCLVRATSVTSARHRVIKSMQDRAVYHNLPLEARRKITCYPADFSKQYLDLNEALYASLAEKITSLVHCAWSVNFNKNLTSFEADCIAGARNLMLLCLAAKQPSPASFNFCSSVSTVASTIGDDIPEALPKSFKSAQGMGYAQSKLVTEHLVTRAAAETGMPGRVLRVGQIIADTHHGIWNDTEAIPLMLQAATTIGALPALDESPRWLPVDNVATTMMDISLSDTTQSVFNVIHPQTFHWTSDLLPALRDTGLVFNEVSQREWIRRLRTSNPDPELNPTIKLVEFFAKKYDNDVVKRKNFNYVTTGAERLSPQLSSVPALSHNLVKKFIQHFLKTSWKPTMLMAMASRGIQPRLIVLLGAPGARKSMIASSLADRLACSVLDADAMQDAIAIAKTAEGIPLTSLDKQIWLERIKLEVLERVRQKTLVQVEQAEGSSGRGDIILASSAFTSSDRDTLRSIRLNKDDEDDVSSIKPVFVALQTTEEGKPARKADAKEQRAAIQTAQLDETDIFPVDAEQEIQTVVEEVMTALNEM